MRDVVVHLFPEWNTCSRDSPYFKVLSRKISAIGWMTACSPVDVGPVTVNPDLITCPKCRAILLDAKIKEVVDG